MSFGENSNTRRLGDAVSAYLRKRSWEVARARWGDEWVFEIKRENINFFVKEVDAQLALAIGVSRFLDRLENFSQTQRSRTGQAVVFVITALPAGLQANVLPQRGIALFTLDEIDELAVFKSSTERSLANLDGRSKVILQGCEAHCVSMAQYLVEQGDLVQAQEWLELNLNGVRRVLQSRYKLIELLVQKGNFEEAKSIARDGLAVSAYNRPLLKRLYDLEERTGNTAELADLQARIEVASTYRPTFETVFQGRGSKASYGAQTTKVAKSTLGNLVRRLFVRA